MLLVALTGGIGSGKSTVAALLEARGAVVVDADAVARDVVEPGKPAFDRIVERFGTGVLAADGTLDRPALGRVVFGDEAARKDLEGITHPAINEEFVRRIAGSPPDGIVVCDIPLLVESQQAAARTYGDVIVVEAPLEVRLDRLEGRGVLRDDARARMKAQATDEERRAVATFVVDNGGSVAELERQVDEVWAALREKAAKQ
ncbi:MAG TPA: dephospho-CoA kinase [Acidimicrobiia bacterium]